MAGQNCRHRVYPFRMGDYQLLGQLPALNHQIIARSRGALSKARRQKSYGCNLRSTLVGASLHELIPGAWGIWAALSEVPRVSCPRGGDPFN